MKIAAWLRFYFHIDPNLLEEEEFWMRWGELRYCLIELGHMTESIPLDKPEGPAPILKAPPKPVRYSGKKNLKGK